MYAVENVNSAGGGMPDMICDHGGLSESGESPTTLTARDQCPYMNHRGVTQWLSSLKNSTFRNR